MKIKSNLIFIVLLLFAGTTLIAQETEEIPIPEKEKHKYLEFQLGFNASNFIRSFVALNNSNLPPTPYDFNGKAFFSFKRKLFVNKIGFRGGFGHENSINVVFQPLNNQAQISYMERLDYRLGLELQKSMGDRVSVYFGLDYIMDKDLSRNTNIISFGGFVEHVDITSDGTAEGWGPVLGIQFNLNRYFCLGTEISFYQMKGRTTTSTTSNSPMFFGQYAYFIRKEKQTLLPTFINFNIRF